MNAVNRALKNDVLTMTGTTTKCGIPAEVIGMFEVEHRTGEMRCPPSVREIFDLPVDGVAHWRDVLKSLYGENRLRGCATIMHSIEPDGRGYFAVENRVEDSEHGERWILVTMHTEFATDGSTPNAIRTVGVVSDITARKANPDASFRSGAATERITHVCCE